MAPRYRAAAQLVACLPQASPALPLPAHLGHSTIAVGAHAIRHLGHLRGARLRGSLVLGLGAALLVSLAVAAALLLLLLLAILLGGLLVRLGLLQREGRRRGRCRGVGGQAVPAGRCSRQACKAAHRTLQCGHAVQAGTSCPAHVPTAAACSRRCTASSRHSAHLLAIVVVGGLLGGGSLLLLGRLLLRRGLLGGLGLGLLGLSVRAIAVLWGGGESRANWDEFQGRDLQSPQADTRFKQCCQQAYTCCK